MAINEQMDIAHLRRRFLKDNNLETNKFFARKQIEKKRGRVKKAAQNETIQSC